LRSAVHWIHFPNGDYLHSLEGKLSPRQGNRLQPALGGAGCEATGVSKPPEEIQKDKAAEVAKELTSSFSPFQCSSGPFNVFPGALTGC
jgi:hypothetical protein